MTIVKKEFVVDAEGKKFVAYKGLYKGFSYSVKFQSSWVEPTCCVHCGRNYGLDRNTVRRVLTNPVSLIMTPIVSYWEEDIVFTYVLHSMFFSCTNLTEIRIPSSISRNGIMEQQLEEASNCCECIIDYLDFLDHPERLYA